MNSARPDPVEHVRRGAALALVPLPIGVGVWLAFWSIGFVGSIIALGIALAAFALYRAGSGGRIGFVGAGIVTGVTVVAIAATFLIAKAIGAAGTTTGDPTELTVAIVLAVAFGGLGCAVAWRAAVVQRRDEQPKPQKKPLPGFENGPGEDRW